MYVPVWKPTNWMDSVFKGWYLAVLWVCFCSLLYRFKKNPFTGLDRPIGFQEVETPRFQDNWHMKVVRLSALCTGHLYPPGNSWYSFLLEAELTSGPWCSRKDYVNEKFQWHHRESNPQPYMDKTRIKCLVVTEGKLWYDKHCMLLFYNICHCFITFV